MRKVNGLVRWWVTPKLPVEHIFIAPEKRPKGLGNVLRVYLRKWMVHPMKRRVAKYYLVVLRKIFGLRVVGITGSAGKTTTKEMAASILRKVGNTVWSVANVDPVYNIPATILRCRPSTKFLVLEMGVEYQGEMDFYLWLARPDVGVITNLGLTHTEFLGGLTGVVREKSKLVRNLDKMGVAVLNGDDSEIRKIKGILAKKMWCGLTAKCEVRGEGVKVEEDGRVSFILKAGGERVMVKLELLGQHFIGNALAAAGVAVSFNVPLFVIKRGLEEVGVEGGRMRPVVTEKYGLVIDDTYNSNPLAAEASLAAVAAMKRRGKLVAVMGDMKELGNEEKKAHRCLGRQVVKLGYDWLLVLGEAAGEMGKAAIEAGMKVNRVRLFMDKREVLANLKQILGSNTICLVKGSRSMGMEELVFGLTGGEGGPII